MKKSMIIIALLCQSFIWLKSQDIVVAKDGSGDYTTVQAAVNAAPSNSSSRTEIYIKNGTYYEVINIASNKTNLTFIGESVNNTILTYDNAAEKTNPSTGSTYGTSGSASTFIDGDGFYALNITFSNTSGTAYGPGVAARVTAEKAIFKNCRFLGNQDTYYPYSGRAYHENCYFEGTTDFIFGGAIGFFENCSIYSKGGTSLTAASTESYIAFGLVFNNCQITGASNGITDLGRPWRPYASVTFLNTNMSGAIKASGWNDWGDPANQSTARFSEYNNSGAGYVPSSRPSWTHILSSSQASAYTMLNVLKANNSNPQVTDNWNPLTVIDNTSPIGGSSYYNIQNRHSSKCLRVENSSSSNNAYIIQEPCNTTYYSMQYELLDAGDNYLYIKNRATTKCMRAVNGYLVQYDCNTGWWSEMFSRQDVGSGYYLLQNRSTGTCLRVENSSTADGARFVLETCNTGWWSQQFSFPGPRSAAGGEAFSSTSHVDLNIYPNPSYDGEITLNISGVEEMGKVYVEIYSYDGKKVFAHEYTGESEISTDLSLSKGLYVVLVKNSENSVSKKIAVQ